MTKATDVLDLYLKFMAGQRLTKLEIKDILEHKSERTVQRYIADLNTFFENKNKQINEERDLTIKYDYKFVQ